MRRKRQKKAVTFPVAYTDPSMVIANAFITVPGTSVSGHAAASITETGFDAHVTRSNNTNTSIWWIAVGYRAKKRGKK